jgi:hypothetical protein
MEKTIPIKHLEQVCYGDIEITYCRYQNSEDCPLSCSLYPATSQILKAQVYRFDKDFKPKDI